VNECAKYTMLSFWWQVEMLKKKRINTYGQVKDTEKADQNGFKKYHTGTARGNVIRLFLRDLLM
jgi:hypothetical protein